MRTDEFKNILTLEGLELADAILKYEKERFDTSFLKGSVYEEINARFGLFPFKSAYPVYFLGNIKAPRDKHVVIGINPGYDADAADTEKEYLKSGNSLLDAYCNIFVGYFKNKRRGLISYFANIAHFLGRLYECDNCNTWNWLHENLINLEFIPYHSSDARGIRINNVDEYYETYFSFVIKMIKYISPSRPVFINGYPTYAEIFERQRFKDDIKMEAVTYDAGGKKRRFWVGKIADEYKCVGLPFLTQITGGKDSLIRAIKDHI